MRPLWPMIACFSFCSTALAQTSGGVPGFAPPPAGSSPTTAAPSNTTGVQVPPPGYSAPPPAPSNTTGVPVAPSGYPAPPPSAAPAAPPGPPYGAPAYGPYGQPPYGYGAYGPSPPGWGPPAQDPHAHRHDGFYFRFGIGAGYGRAKTTGTLGSTDLTAHYSGAGPAYELLFGGTVARGFVVGGGFLGQDISDPSTTIESNDPSVPSTLNVSGALGVLALGPFIDWFPDDTGGAHVGAMVGLGGVGLKDRSGNADVGIGGSLWTGYDFWIANQWSLGGELRAVFAQGTREVDAPSTGFFGNTARFDDSAASFELVFTALLH